MAGIGTHPRIGMPRQLTERLHQGLQHRRSGIVIEYDADAQLHVEAGFRIGDNRQQRSQPRRFRSHQLQHLCQISLLQQVVNASLMPSAETLRCAQVCNSVSER